VINCEGVYQIGTSVTLGGQASDFEGDLSAYIWLDGNTAFYNGQMQTISGGTPEGCVDYHNRHRGT